jgi:hypothetical protein
LRKLAKENLSLTQEGWNFLLNFCFFDAFGNQQCCLYDYEKNKYKRLWRSRWGVYYVEYWTTWEKYDNQQEVVSKEIALKVIQSFFKKVEEIKKRNIEKEEKRTAKLLAAVLDD